MPKNLPETDHFVRHCSPQKLVRDGGEVVGVFPQAFELRAGEEYLSGSWPEFFRGERKERLQQTAAAMRAAGRSLSLNSALVEVQVGGMLQSAKKNFGRRLRALHEPDRGRGNDAYATVRGMPEDATLDFLDQVFVASHISITQIRELEHDKPRRE